MEETQIKNKNNVHAVLLAVVFFILGILVGYHNQPAINKITGVANKETSVTTTADFDPFWKAWNILDSKYIDTTKSSDQDRVYGAIAGMVASMGDPYTVFFKPTEAKSFEDDIAGSFSGIGVEVGMKDNILTVIAPLKGTPGDKAGVKPGDQILKIDNTSTENMSVDTAIGMIRGDKGTTVSLTIFRQGEKSARVIKIVRDIINTPTLDTEARPDGIFVIKLYSFSATSASLFQNAMKQFDASGDNKMILDLRGNPGGYLDAAVDMASFFLPSGQTVVIEDYGGKAPQTIHRSSGYNTFGNKELVILMNGGSASASEILSGALHDHGIAKLVGTQSYGKGSVQEVLPVTANTILKVTIAKWLTPNGISISLKGLTPDVKVDLTQADLDAKRDPQMDKAVQLLKNWTPIVLPKATN